AFLRFVTCAVVSLILAAVFEETTLERIWLATPALVHGGVFAVGVGYALQVVAPNHATAPHAAIILSLEARFAAIAGAIFLAESLSLRGYAGCTLMSIGMLIAQLWPRKPSDVLDPAPASSASDNSRTAC